MLVFTLGGGGVYKFECCTIWKVKIIIIKKRINWNWKLYKEYIIHEHINNYIKSN